MTSGLTTDGLAAESNRRTFTLGDDSRQNSWKESRTLTAHGVCLLHRAGLFVSHDSVERRHAQA